MRALAREERNACGVTPPFTHLAHGPPVIASRTLLPALKRFVAAGFCRAFFVLLLFVCCTNAPSELPAASARGVRCTQTCAAASRTAAEVHIQMPLTLLQRRRRGFGGVAGSGRMMAGDPGSPALHG